jgi:hypothetical protein
MAVKQFVPQKFESAIYEIMNCARICEEHPNVVNLRAV